MYILRFTSTAVDTKGDKVFDYPPRTFRNHNIVKCNE